MVVGGGVNCHETSSLGFRGVPLSSCPRSPLVLLSSCAPSTTQPLHHNFQPVRLRHHLFEASEHLNIETTIPFSSNRHPSLKEMKCSVMFRLPLNL